MLTKRFKGFSPRNMCFADDGAAPAAGGAPAAVKVDAANGSASATVDTTAGGAAKVSQEGSSASAAVPAVVGQTADPAATDWRAGFDDTLKNDPALKDVKDPASLAKMYLDTKKLVGQKLGIPGADATPEAKAAFQEAMGVPKDPTGYGFKKPDNLPEGMGYDEADAAEWAKTFKEHGVPAPVANALRDKLLNAATEAYKTMKTSADNDISQSDAEFEKISLRVFGDKDKATKALQTARVDIERYADPSLKANLSQLSDSALALFAQVYNAKVKELGGKENQDIDGGGNAGGGGQTRDQLRTEAKRLQALPEYSSAFTAKGKDEHQRIVKEVRDLYDKIGKMAS